MEKFTYDNALKYLDWLCIFGIKEGLERIKELAEALGNPQNFYETIHVAGTNGKGSVCAMLSEMLKAQGLRVGLFTSPHLESYCERIKIDGENIGEEDFARMIKRVKDCNVVATHFEVLTAAAFLYFKECEVDVAVIEVGLGGLYDSTNIIKPKISVITNVARDHENILGNLEGIAKNKAGIIKRNVPTITGATGEPLEIIRKTAREKNSVLYEVINPADVNVNLRGEYQKINAAVAIKAAQVFGLDESAIATGLTRVTWAGRFEVVNTANGIVVIDGAHNPHGANALRQSLDKNFPQGKRVWVFGALRDKDFPTMIDLMFRKNDFVIVTPPDSERAATCEILCAAIRERGIDCIGIEDNFAAVERLLNSEAEVKIIAGSLYLIGAVRKFIKAV
ncbi:MAG: bifunctional folylpolyglutamate synthase/dihydrofolate synthase [Selenomonadaceae bacterium]|nr:bifunctional folylpolyglutamate synthase/dihydrofolate synthase [Selenomonadaceae bacterium]